MLALAKIAIQPGQHRLSPLITPEARSTITRNAWPAFASFSWAFIMYIFRWYPDTIQSSLKSSMNYMYVDYHALILVHTTLDFQGRLSNTLLTPFFHSYVDSNYWDSFHTLFVQNK
jgi:hypothetical protein